MCGITGICVKDLARGVDARLLEAMTASLAHRGPDGSGSFVGPHVGLGHRRLSIIDLATGDQPIYNEDGSIALVFNGEIYNYKELRQELMARGHQLRTQSDTEVIVHLYEDFGDDCVDHLNGMFAFALWDAKHERLLVARDRLGERPVYYAEHNGRLLFGSELKAILQDRSIPRDVDLGALDDYLAYGYIPAPATIYTSVRKLRAGERLVWDARTGVRTNIYWKVPFAPGRIRTEDEWVAELRALLVDSIALRLRSDVPVGAFLSGGLDSNGIVALAAQQLGTPLQTFSVGFGEADFDELALARLTARRYNTDHHEIMVRPGDLSSFVDLVNHFDEPFADASMLPTYYVAREARRFVKVCISGDAGDELFAGYSQYRQVQRYATIDKIPLPVRRVVFGAGAALLPDSVPGKGLFDRLSVEKGARYQRQIGVFSLRERRRLLRPEAGAARCAESRLFDPFYNANGLDPISISQLVDQNTYLPEDVLVKVDRAALKNGLEVRIPFLDHRLVELVNSMPLDLKLRGGVTKYILRRLLRDDLPPEILTAPKRGFGMPLKHWLRGELRDFARDLLLSPDSRSAAYFERPAVERLLASHDRRGRDMSERIWTLLVFEQWCRAAA
uniref:asparagine synthase (glutamine-hydrolyzing) n=1 Tax=uncultured bacterium lac193 TaxID=1447243 RepID=X2LJV9_9BACT|nr:asparagine synthase [uncultured bacterium lac193]